MKPADLDRLAVKWDRRATEAGVDAASLSTGRHEAACGLALAARDACRALARELERIADPQG